MAKKSKHKKKPGGGPPKVAAAPATTDTAATSAAAPVGAGLGAKRGPRARPEKVSAKDLSALAKQAARAKWDERMTAEGR